MCQLNECSYPTIGTACVHGSINGLWISCLICFKRAKPNYYSLLVLKDDSRLVGKTAVLLETSLTLFFFFFVFISFALREITPIIENAALYQGKLRRTLI